MLPEKGHIEKQVFAVIFFVRIGCHENGWLNKHQQSLEGQRAAVAIFNLKF